jgi:hypothetical protein
MRVNPKFIKFVKMHNASVQQVFGFNHSSSAFEGGDSKLCIEVGPDFYSYCISDLSGKQIHSFGYFHSNLPIESSQLNSLFDLQNIKGFSFNDVVLIHNRAEMALVPSVFHQPETATTILQTIHGDLEELKVMEDDVHQWELFNVYGWNAEIYSVVSEKFPQVRHVQFVTAALRSLFKSLSIDKEQLLKVYFYQKTFTVIALKDTQLQLAQSFHFETPQDVIYHLLNLVDRLRFDLATVAVEVSGLLDIHSETWKELNKFFIEVDIEEFTGHHQEANQVNEVPSHFYTPFLISPRCV